MRIVVFGTGAVGAYFGGRLAQAGEEVVFISRGANLKAMQSEGLKVQSIKGDFHVYPVQVFEDPAQAGKADVILVAVKAWQVPEVARQMVPMLGEHTAVIPLGNGVDAPGQLAEVLGSQYVLGGFCRISCHWVAPGVFRHVAIEPYVAFNELAGKTSPRVEALRQAFERANVSVETPDDILTAVWQKFLFIVSVSGVGAVTRSPIGVQRSVPGSRSLLAGALSEVELVARAMGINLPEGAAARMLEYIDTLPYETTASMARDIMEGRPSELEAQNGALVRMGKQCGIATPTHQFIYDSLLPQELKATGRLP